MNIRQYTIQKAKALIANPEFQSAVAKTRQSNRIEDSGLADDASIEVWYAEHINKRPDAEKPLDDAVAEILLRFGLGSDWRHSIKRYVFLNDPNDMQLPMRIEMGTIRDEQTDQLRVVVYIPEYASQNDITAALPEITKWQNKIRGKPLKRQPAPNDALAKDALAIYRRVKSYKKTSVELNEKIENDDDKLDQWQVRNLIRNYKKRVGIN